MDITRLEEERMQLRLSRDINLIKINNYERLITYYCTLYTKTLTNINEKKDSINLYESIITFKKLISSPKILEKISIISNEYLMEKISELEKKIEILLSRSDELRAKTIEYKEEKLKLEDENARVEDDIDIVNDNIKRYGLSKKVAR